MQIALLSPMPPERNGIADYAQQFTDALRSRGQKVAFPLQGISLENRAAAARWVDETCWQDIDIVHSQFGGGRVSEFLALEALATKRWSGRRPLLTATVHDPERLVWRPLHRFWRAPEQRGRLTQRALRLLALVVDPFTLRAERRLAAMLDGFVTLTRAGAASLCERLRIPHERVTVIEHGTCEIPARPLPPPSPLRLIYFGFIYRGKGIEDLLDALARVHIVLPGSRGLIRLTLAGGTAPSMAYGSASNYLDELRARIVALELGDFIDWQLDVPERDIATVIQRHHAAVLPYRESRKLALLGRLRGTSGALAWTIACGRGAITSDARSFAEEIQTGNGVAYPQGDVRALAACIGRLVKTPALAQSWADAASRLAELRAWPRTASRFEHCFVQSLKVRA